MTAAHEDVDVWLPAQRLAPLGLHPSHDFRYYTLADCASGDHAWIVCANPKCGVSPIVPFSFCYHYLWTGTAPPQALADHGAYVDPAALAPCPGKPTA